MLSALYGGLVTSAKTVVRLGTPPGTPGSQVIIRAGSIKPVGVAVAVAVAVAVGVAVAVAVGVEVAVGVGVGVAVGEGVGVLGVGGILRVMCCRIAFASRPLIIN